MLRAVPSFGQLVVPLPAHVAPTPVGFRIHTCRGGATTDQIYVTQLCTTGHGAIEGIATFWKYAASPCHVVEESSIPARARSTCSSPACLCCAVEDPALDAQMQ